VMLDNDLMNPRYTYVDYLSDHQQNVDYGLSSVQASLTNLNATLDDEIGQNVLIMNKDEVAIYDFVVSEEGYYHIEVDYKVAAATLNQITVAVKVNGQVYYDEMSTIEIPIIWQDESKTYLTDRYGDEVLPNQVIDGS